MRLGPSILSACVLLAAAAPACASDVTLFDSLGGTFDGANYPYQEAYASFSDVTLNLLSGDPGYGDGAFSVYLLADSSTSPGGVIATLAASVPDSSLTTSPANYSFSVAPGIDLAAKTRYWIEVEKTPLALTEWSWTYDSSGVGVAGVFRRPQPAIL
jgi:hypothetical protein